MFDENGNWIPEPEYNYDYDYSDYNPTSPVTSDPYGEMTRVDRSIVYNPAGNPVGYYDDDLNYVSYADIARDNGFTYVPGGISTENNIITNLIDKLGSGAKAVGEKLGLTKPNGDWDWSKVGLAGTGVLGALSALTGETKTPKTETLTQQSQTSGETRGEVTLPDWYLKLLKGQAEGVPGLPGYQGFTKTLPQIDIQPYMNQYLGAAIDPVLRRLNEDQAQQRHALDAALVSKGAFGASRGDLLQNQMLERQALEKTNLMSDAYSKAFGTGQTAAMSDLNRMYQDWQTQQLDPRQLAASQATILGTLKPGQITTGTSTGTSGVSQVGVEKPSTPGTLEQLSNLSGTLWGMVNNTPVKN